MTADLVAQLLGAESDEETAAAVAGLRAALARLDELESDLKVTRALHRAQGRVGSVKKNKHATIGRGFAYAEAAEFTRTGRTVCHEEGLVLVIVGAIETGPDELRCHYELRHIDGGRIAFDLSQPIPKLTDRGKGVRAASTHANAEAYKAQLSLEAADPEPEINAQAGRPKNGRNGARQDSPPPGQAAAAPPSEAARDLWARVRKTALSDPAADEVLRIARLQFWGEIQTPDACRTYQAALRSLGYDVADIQADAQRLQRAVSYVRGQQEAAREEARKSR